MAENIKFGKLKNLVQNYPKGLVLTSEYLTEQGFSPALQQQYRRSSWLKSLGKGAMIRVGELLSLTGALAALQKQSRSDAHIGGSSALELHGNAQYLRTMFGGKSTVFTSNKKNLPSWFMNLQWDVDFFVFSFSLFTDNMLGLSDFKDGELTMKISARERAIMECLYLCPDKFSLEEAMEIMDGLSSLRHDLVQELLEKCVSVKVKRLFLYFAERSSWEWFDLLDLSCVDLGTGVRSLSNPNNENFYSKKYQLTLPKTLL